MLAVLLGGVLFLKCLKFPGGWEMPAVSKLLILNLNKTQKLIHFF